MVMLVVKKQVIHYEKHSLFGRTIIKGNLVNKLLLRFKVSAREEKW